MKYIAKNKNINGYKSMPNNKLLRIINKKNNNNNNNKSDTRSPFNRIEIYSKKIETSMATKVCPTINY